MSGDRASAGWLKMEVSLGAIIMAASILVGVAGWAYTAAGRADQAGKDLQELQLRMERRFDGVEKRLGEIDAKTIVIPTQGQRVEQLNKQHDEDMLRIGSMERRQGDMERIFAAFVATTTAQLDAVMHPNLPPVRTTR
jgi:hypothetical protein